MNFSGISIIIPALDPDEKLLSTVISLEQAGFDDIILVDDGSKVKNRVFFPDVREHPRCTILRHKVNRGKGAALKTAFRYILRERPGCVGVVTADSDGQHTTEDIIACTEKMLRTHSVVLGARDFRSSGIPARSRFGNKMTCLVFKLLCGLKITDTQTGLRAIPARYIKSMIGVSGNRYEYETNVLLSLSRNAIPYAEQKINTVYIDDNKSSHFRPIRDSLRIYKFILIYCASSISSCLIDLLAFFLLSLLIKSGGARVFICTLLARIISSICNFFFNKKGVFASKGNTTKQFVRYYMLAIPQMLCSALGVYLLKWIFGNPTGSFLLTLLKAIVDISLFFISFRIQQTWVFASKRTKKHRPQTERDSAARADDSKEIKMANNGKKRNGKKLSTGKIVRRVLLTVGTLLLAVVITLYSVCFVIAHGPSITLRNQLVLMATQASATRWVPDLVLDSATVVKIIEDSKKINTDIIDPDDIPETEDDWSKAKDGMLYYEINGQNYKAYMLIIKDPSRVSVGVSSENFAAAKAGGRFYEIAQKYNALAVLNAGEFADYGGTGSGAQPVGITYAQGKLAWNDGCTNRTYIGFDKNNKLILRNGITVAQANELGIRDMVAFQVENILIETVDDEVKIHYKPGDTGTSQRTAIGQRADGAVIFLVTDGRTASCLGATPSDVISMMLEHGAINAAMLDGGSSTMLYYRDYIAKYGIDTTTLDQYQKMGLVNRYKAFVEPRRIPTYFIVTGE